MLEHFLRVAVGRGVSELTSRPVAECTRLRRPPPTPQPNLLGINAQRSLRSALSLFEDSLKKYLKRGEEGGGRYTPQFHHTFKKGFARIDSADSANSATRPRTATPFTIRTQWELVPTVRAGWQSGTRPHSGYRGSGTRKPGHENMPGEWKGSFAMGGLHRAPTPPRQKSQAFL